LKWNFNGAKGKVGQGLGRAAWFLLIHLMGKKDKSFSVLGFFPVSYAFSLALSIDPCDLLHASFD